MNSSNKEINSVSLDDKRAESESEYPQVCEKINNANDLAECSNAGRLINRKSPLKNYYPNSETGQVLVLLLGMLPPCLGCRKNIGAFQI